MQWIKKLVAFLKPFRELIVIVVALVGAAYGAVSYFATADQLAKAQAELKELQESKHDAALDALKELKCINRLNRELLRAELQEFRLTTLLQKNLLDSEKLRGNSTDFARENLVILSAHRETLANGLRTADTKKQEVLAALRDNTCSGTV